MIAAMRRQRCVSSANAPAISHRPVTKITVAGIGTQAGVMARNLSGAHRWPTPAAR